MQRAHLINLPVGSSRGYRWKTLFLPEGTRLRMHCAGKNFDAIVEGDELVFEGRSMSPRQMTLAVSGQGYNAWRALWVRRRCRRLRSAGSGRVGVDNAAAQANIAVV